MLRGTGEALALAALFLLPGAGAPTPSSPANPGFETLDRSGAPAAWLFPAEASDLGYRFESAPGSTGRGGRLHAIPGAAPDPAAGGSISQTIDAAPWRGGLVRFRARLKVDRPGLFVGLGLKVLRPAPKIAGYRDFMRDRPIGAGGWTEFALTGRVARDAETITLSLNVSGDADVTIDDVSIEAVPPDPRPPGAAASAYLGEAVALIRANHIDAATADWGRILADARADIGGAEGPRDAYMAIRGVLGALGEKHSIFLPASSQPPPGAAFAAGPAPPAPPMPSSLLVGGRFGRVRLPQLNTIGPQGQALGQAYSARLREMLTALDGQGVCGWIVDLRDNGGGNMWPMLQGLDPLLGPAPFGWFVRPKGDTKVWQRSDGTILPAPAVAPDAPPAFGLRHAGAPLALLLGPRTASSGEMTAIALIGRKDVRSFGKPTAGYTTANRPLRLSDGATLVITGAFVRDRGGRDYRDEIRPDVEAEDAEAAASAWLGSMCPAPTR